MRAYIIYSVKSLEKVEKDWKDLYLRVESENPFLSWEWNIAWIQAFADHKNIRVVIVEDANEVIAIAPFVLEKTRVMFLSDSLFADYMDILTARQADEVFDLIFSSLSEATKWDKLDLLTIPETSLNSKAIEMAVRKLAIFTERRCIHLNPYVDTTKDFDKYIEGRSKGIKKELRRTRNKLANESASWEFFEAQSNEEKEWVLDSLIKFHLQRQDNKVGTSIFGDKVNRDFYRELITTKEMPWAIHLAGIRIDDRLVTASVSIICGKVFYYWITAFDYSLGGGSVGNYHVKLLLEKCFRENIDRFDFMGGTESYKMRWSEVTYDNYQILAYRSRIKKMRDYIWITLRDAMKKIKNNSDLASAMWTRISKYVGK